MSFSGRRGEEADLEQQNDSALDSLLRQVQQIKGVRPIFRHLPAVCCRSCCCRAVRTTATTHTHNTPHTTTHRPRHPPRSSRKTSTKKWAIRTGCSTPCGAGLRMQAARCRRRWARSGRCLRRAGTSRCATSSSGLSHYLLSSTTSSPKYGEAGGVATCAKRHFCQLLLELSSLRSVCVSYQ